MNTELRDRPPGADGSPPSEAGVDEVRASTPALDPEPTPMQAGSAPDEATDTASSPVANAEEVERSGHDVPTSSAPQEQERSGEGMACERCGGPMAADVYDAGFTQCADCDPDGEYQICRACGRSL